MFNLLSIFRRRAARPTRPAQRELQADWIIFGLGNPGAKYETTRHNVGYMAVDDILADQGDVLEAVPGVPALAAQLTIGDSDVVVLRSTTFMNLSGQALLPLAQRLGVPAERIIVIHDELDLPVGKVRLKLGGNENGHNGLKSTSELLDTRDYLRVRIGISRPPKGMGVSDYVLSPIDANAETEASIATAAEAARLIISTGLSKAQNLIHSR